MNKMHYASTFFSDLYQISDVNEQQGVITVKLWLYYYYYSEEAKWNSSEFQRQALLVPKGTFWEADIGNYIYIRCSKKY